MDTIEMFLWSSIALSGVVLFGYEIWNFIVVSKDLIRISKTSKNTR